MLRNVSSSRLAMIGARHPLIYTPVRSFNMVEVKQEDIVKQRKEKPTSPHLTIYKLPMPAIMSITQRGAGIALNAMLATASIGMLGANHELVYYVSALQSTGALVPLIKFAVAFPLTFYSAVEARHLIWDASPTNHLTLDKVHKTNLLIIGATSAVSLALAFLSF